MKPIRSFPHSTKKNIRYILTDIDDTLTIDGILPAAIFAAMERLKKAGIRIIPVTGRPAGWCDHIARMWPVDALVGENGAFYYRYDRVWKKMIRTYWKSEDRRREDRKKLDRLREQILCRVPGCRIASDQPYRDADLAIDYCEDVDPLPPEDVLRIVRCFTEAGAQAKISSIHVNGWFGDYDKLSMTRKLFEDIFNEKPDSVKTRVIYIGDSPNDAPMFAYFPHSVGVANILRFRENLPSPPVWITEKEGGFGFAEMVSELLS